MSDKETAPPPYEPAFSDPSFWPVLLSHVMGGSIRQLASAEKMIRAQVERRAPAPQPAHEGRLSGQQITDMMRHWHEMQDDPYFPSDPKIFSLLLEVSARRIEAATPQVTPTPAKEVLGWMIRSGRKRYMFATKPAVEPVYEYGGYKVREVIVDEGTSEQAPPTPEQSRDTGVSLDGGKTIHSKFKND